MNAGESQALRQVFASYCRLTRAQLLEQREMLRALYEAAASAQNSVPVAPVIEQIDKMTLEQGQALGEYVDARRKAIGARDAYASALVIYFDGLLRTLWTYYKKLSDFDERVNAILTVGVSGIPVGKIIRAAANNVRHYMDWADLLDIADAPRRKAINTCTTLAVVLNLENPEPQTISRFARNLAWPVLQVLGGGTFDGFLGLVMRYQREMISNAGVAELVG